MPARDQSTEQIPSPTKKATDTLNWVGAFLTEKRDERFHGQVILHHNAGTIVRVEVIESIVPPGDPRGKKG